VMSINEGMCSISKGGFRVGINFDPSNDDTVSYLKQVAADFIEAVEKIPVPDEGRLAAEVPRLKALAQTAAEEAAMWGVKAATKHL